MVWSLCPRWTCHPPVKVWERCPHSLLLSTASRLQPFGSMHDQHCCCVFLDTGAAAVQRSVLTTRHTWSLYPPQAWEITSGFPQRGNQAVGMHLDASQQVCWLQAKRSVEALNRPKSPNIGAAAVQDLSLTTVHAWYLYLLKA